MGSFSWGDLKKAAEDAGFVLVPKGTYDVTVTKSEAKKTGTGKDQIKVTFKILSGPMAGKPLPNSFVISPESGVALGFFFRHMKAMGLDSSYFATLPVGDVGMKKLANDLLGKTCQVDVIDDDKWNEELRNKITSIRAISGAMGAAPAGVPQVVPQPVPQPQPVAQPQPAAAAPQPVAQPAPVPVPQPVVEDPATEGPGNVVDDELVDEEPTSSVIDEIKPPDLPF
jgi:hypothetical protein